MSGEGVTELSLLSYLDALVRSDTGYPGFAGSVCVGVKREDETRWWQAHFAASRSTEYLDEMPTEYDVAVGVDAQTARWLLGLVEEPGPTLLITGDKKLLSKFLNRYVRHTSPLSLRISVGLGKT